MYDSGSWKCLGTVQKTSRSALSDTKYKAKAKCFRSDKARTVRFLNGLRNKPLNMPIHEESLKINVFKGEKFGEK